MLKFVLKRILMLIPVILGIVLIVFTIMYLTPGDPARLILGEKAPQEQVDVLRDQMGLNDPFVVQFARYVGNMLRGDFGRSYATNIPVAETIAERFPKTAELALAGMFLSVLIGMPIGILSAVKRYSILDNISMIFAMLATAIPAFWLGMMLIIAFSLNLKWFPSSGFDTFRQMVLPTITLAAVNAAVIIRMTRSSMLEVVRQDYIRTAWAKGADQKRVVLGHALKNSIIPVITVIAMQVGRMIGGVVVCETVFAMPGIGREIVDSILSRDYPVAMGLIMSVAIIVVFINTFIDVVYVIIDPRISHNSTAG